MFNKILKTALLSVSLFASYIPTSAHAVSLTPGSQYQLTGSYIAQFLNGGNQYLATLGFGSNSLTAGSLSGGVLSSLNLNGVLASTTIHKYVNNSWVALTDSSSLNSNIVLNQTNFRVNGDGTLGSGINGQTSFSGSSISLNGTVEGAAIASTFTLVPSFMNFTSAQAGYGLVVDAFSSNGSLNFASAFFQNSFHSWLGSNQVPVSGVTFYGGDIHASVSEVPEPATMTLLGAGLLGAISRRKKLALKN